MRHKESDCVILLDSVREAQLDQDQEEEEVGIAEPAEVDKTARRSVGHECVCSRLSVRRAGIHASGANGSQ